MSARSTMGVAFLALVGSLGSCAPGSNISREQGSPAPPNIVFVLLDDVRYDDLVDHPFVDLPNLDRLAGEGVSFQRFFTSAPLCSPSRAVFMTGQYAHRNGIIDNGERAELSHQIVTFPRLLHDAGYRTGFFGKWHMGHEDDSPRPGFDRWVSFVGQGVYFDPQLNVDGESAAGEGYMTDLLTDHAVSFIDSSTAESPFLAFIAHKAVHPEIFPDYVRTFPPAPGDEALYEDDELPRKSELEGSARGQAGPCKTRGLRRSQKPSGRAPRRSDPQSASHAECGGPRDWPTIGGPRAEGCVG